PMHRCFQNEPVVVHYDVLQPQVDLQEKNTRRSAFWRESLKMDFTEYDRAPEDELNRILWFVAKGDVPYPTPRHGAIFTR
ncbi:MAG: hypothetical protein JNL44_18460, partial [Gemmatimonadetes bacterium]|nr:hypothetical protein [Gemmatimonadota bacterium]